MIVYTSSYSNADYFITTPMYNIGNVISIASPTINDKNIPKQQMPKSINTCNYLRLMFNDADFEDLNSILKFTYIYPSKEHIEQIISFYNIMDKSKNVLCYCEMGVSRSTACAILINLLHYEKNINISIENVKKANKYLYPNDIMIYYIDEVLNLNGHLIKEINLLKEDYVVI